MKFLSGLVSGLYWGSVACLASEVYIFFSQFEKVPYDLFPIKTNVEDKGFLGRPPNKNFKISVHFLSTSVHVRICDT